MKTSELNHKTVTYNHRKYKSLYFTMSFANIHHLYVYAFVGVEAKKETIIHIAWTQVKLLNLDFLLSNHLIKCLMTASKASKRKVFFEVPEDPFCIIVPSLV